MAQPYQFTENVDGVWDWVVPGILCCAGTFLNVRFTKKGPLHVTWLGAFALEGVLRSLWFHTPVAAALAPMTGVACLLFTFYIISNPATTPQEPRRPVLFGASVAAVYSVLQVVHVVFGLFFELLDRVHHPRSGALRDGAAPGRGSSRERPRPGKLVMRRSIAMSAAVAIIGLACRYADTRSPTELWENVLARRRAFRPVPQERISLSDYAPRRDGDTDTTYLAPAAPCSPIMCSTAYVSASPHAPSAPRT